MKVTLKLLVLLISFSVMAATNEEKQLLKSWGVKESNEGMIIYQGIHSLPPTYWVSTPLPLAYNIDYSVLPVNFKPLVIYGQ